MYYFQEYSVVIATRQRGAIEKVEGEWDLVLDGVTFKALCSAPRYSLDGGRNGNISRAINTNCIHD